MKRVTSSHHMDRIGVLAVAQKVHKEFGWLLRPQEVDYGIDAIIEVVIDGQPTGKMIAAQIKSGPSYFKEATETAISFRGKLVHLDYWLNHDLPVIVILYDPKDGVAYWQSVIPQNVTKTVKGWKLLIPRDQRIEPGQAGVLDAIAAQNEQFKAVASEFTCPCCGAPLVERAGGDFDYESYACGYTIQSVYQRPCPFDPAFPKYEDYNLEFHECGSSTEKTWLCIPVPATRNAHRLRLEPGTGKTQEDAEKLIRAEYERCSRKRKEPRLGANTRPRPYDPAT